MTAVIAADSIAKYRLHQVIGRGGSSVVYRAVNDHQPALPPLVALKVANDECSADPNVRCQFREQARASALVQHPAVLPVVDSGEEQGRPYLVMPLIVGDDLAHRLTAGAPSAGAPTAGSLTVGRMLVLLRQVADGLDAMHASGVLHLDVKPSNVLVGRAAPRSAGPFPAEQPERAFLTDLGLRHLGTDFVGSPRYASPEHLRGRAVTPASDVYSLSCLLFACLAGRPPYIGDIPTVVTGHLSGRVPSVSALTALPRCLDRIIRRGMHPDPGSRFGSCAELMTGARLAIVDGEPWGTGSRV